jgi:hypothetical protein
MTGGHKQNENDEELRTQVSQRRTSGSRNTKQQAGKRVRRGDSKTSDALFAESEENMKTEQEQKKWVLTTHSDNPHKIVTQLQWHTEKKKKNHSARVRARATDTEEDKTNRTGTKTNLAGERIEEMVVEE